MFVPFYVIHYQPFSDLPLPYHVTGNFNYLLSRNTNLGMNVWILKNRKYAINSELMNYCVMN